MPSNYEVLLFGASETQEQSSTLPPYEDPVKKTGI